MHSVRKLEPPGNSLKLETSFFRQSSGQQTAELPFVSEETTYDRGAPSSRTFCNLSLQFREIRRKEGERFFVCPIDLGFLINKKINAPPGNAGQLTVSVNDSIVESNAPVFRE